MLLGIFQTFSEQLFIRQLWTAALVYKLLYFQKLALGKKVFLKASKFTGKHLCQSLFLIKWLH